MDFLIFIWLIINASCLAVVFGAKFQNILPGFVQDLIFYGKTRPSENKRQLHWSRKLLVPNRWFMHFYAIGLLWNVFLLATFIQTIVKEDTSYPDVFRLAHIMAPNSKNSQLDCFSISFTLVLLTIQLIRRLYESLFVSSFSGKMHLGHYALGMVFYGLLSLTVVAEIPHSISKGWYESCQTPSKHMSWSHVVALLLFLWASYHQYQCHTILGKLTSWSSDGTKIYKIPYGDWFEYISSPHYLAEILIYIALFFAMKGQSLRWVLVLTFVMLNLTLTAHNSHLWYKRKFDDYPKHRHIIIPYVY